MLTYLVLTNGNNQYVNYGARQQQSLISVGLMSHIELTLTNSLMACADVMLQLVDSVCLGAPVWQSLWVCLVGGHLFVSILHTSSVSATLHLCRFNDCRLVPERRRRSCCRCSSIPEGSLSVRDAATLSSCFSPSWSITETRRLFVTGPLCPANVPRLRFH